MRSSGVAHRPWRGPLALALAAALLAGCGGGGNEKPEGLSEGAHLAARLPTDNALNIAMVDVDGVRRTLGMGPKAAPPTGSTEDDQAFLGETGPALGILQGGHVPTPIADELVVQAHSIASVTGDRAVTAVSTTTDPAPFEDMLRKAGLVQEDDSTPTFVPEDGTYAIAIGDGVIAIAETPGDARSVIEQTDGEVPHALDEIDGDGQLVTLARFGANCIDSIATSDSVHRPGEVAFFTSATPDAAKIVSTDPEAGEPQVVGDSARITLAAADDPSQEPPALKALLEMKVDYDCGG
jgi:hypothetical protein